MEERSEGVEINRVEGQQTVPIECVDEDPSNVRGQTKDVGELAASIQIHGILQPLLGVRTGAGRVRLIAGHRRLAAAKLAGLAHVPVVVRDVDPSVAKEMQIVENVQREDLPALDVADALMVMTKAGQTAEVIAERIGKSAAWVRRHLALLKLDGKVLEAVRKHQLRFTQAEQVARVLKAGSLDAALEAAKDMAAGKLSRRSSEQTLAEGAKPDASSSRKTFVWSGDTGRATLAVESKRAIDPVRKRQLQELVSAVERILAEAA